MKARALLWEHVDDDCYARSLLDACEHIEVLGQDELAQWRGMLAEGGNSPAAAGDPHAAERHLGERLAAISPLTREPDAAATTAKRRFDAALEALGASGVLGDEAARGWRARDDAAAEASWLDDDDLAEAEAVMRQYELAAHCGRARRVFVPERVQRHDGLAIIAVVTRTEASEILFHHVGEPEGDDTDGFAGLEAFRNTIDRLLPPKLSDDEGTAYASPIEQPVSVHGTGGIPDPDRPRVITGVWRYQPPAPESAAAFDVRTNGASWRLG